MTRQVRETPGIKTVFLKVMERLHQKCLENLLHQVQMSQNERVRIARG